MCKFKSSIVVKDPKQKGGFRLLLSPWTDSHSDLIALHSLRDDGKLRFARVEYSPPDMSVAHLPDKYKLTIDEERTPEWFDKDMKAAVAEKMDFYIKSIIVSGEVALLMGGQFIVAPSAKIGAVKNAFVASVSDARIDHVSGSARIDSVSGDASIDHVSGSARIDSVSGDASIGIVSGSARIDSVSGNASIGIVSGSARIDHVYGSASIDSVYGSARIGIVSGSARIDSVSGDASIDHVSGSARIDSVSGDASIGIVSGSARIDHVYGSASIGIVYGSARIGIVYGSARIVKDERNK